MTDLLQHTEPHVRDLVDDERIAALRVIAEEAPGGSFRAIGEAGATVVTGAGTFTANGVMWSDEEDDISLLEGAVEEFPDISAPWGVEVRGSVNAEVRGIARRRGLTSEAMVPTMVASLADQHPDESRLARIGLLRPHEAPLLAAAIAEGFGVPTSQAAPYASESLLARPGVVAAGIRTTDGRLASVGVSVTVDPSVVGLFAIATIPSMRGRSLARAVTLRLMNEARSRGADTAYLQASTMGYGVYREIGFSTVEELTYLW